MTKETIENKETLEAKSKLVITCPEMLPPDVLQTLGETYQLVIISCKADEQELGRALEGAKYLVMGGTEKITHEIASKYPDLSYLFLGEQAETSFEPEAWEIVKEKVRRTGGGVEAVAQKTVAQIKEFSKNGLNIGAIGAGRIGSRVIELLHEKRAKIVYWEWSEQENFRDRGKYMNNIHEVFKTASIVTVHLSLNEATANLITLEDLMSLPNGAIFINNARAGLIPPETLLSFLKARPDVKVIYDTFYIEGVELETLKKKKAKDQKEGELQEILGQPNFKYTSHTAAFSETTYQEYGKSLLKILEEDILN